MRKNALEIAEIKEQERVQEKTTDGVSSIGSTRVKHKFIPKLGNPGKFSISCSLGSLKVDNALCDSGSSISVMSLDMVERLGIKTLKHHPISITFGYSFSKKSYGILEDYPLKIGECIVPTDFVVMKMKKTKELPLLHGTPFLNTTGAKIDFDTQRVVFTKVDDEVFYPLKPPLVGFCRVVSEDVDEFKDYKMKYVGSIGTIEEAQPLTDVDKKKESLIRPDLEFEGDFFSDDEACLESLSPTPSEKELSNNKGKGSSSQYKSPTSTKPLSLGSSSKVLTLTPWKFYWWNCRLQGSKQWRIKTIC
ncbi:uncharacterized protein LOC112081559 [Eutrema salsugineum]|uniref:uncharacterized protein LOC112081559 n=1 Tax=Eutrema salsugineum TaxID=72664 RepID=UPI000CED1FE2|nr:uncharacterized protein LOC112081559 [Eutrema salsugineum]